jgi:hypothetical protein
MPRQTISSAILHAMLVREYLDARLVDCVSRCRMPEPIFREVHGEGEANWYIRPPLSCPRHCHRVIDDVVRKLGTVYDMEEPPRIAA